MNDGNPRSVEGNTGRGFFSCQKHTHIVKYLYQIGAEKYEFPQTGEK